MRLLLFLLLSISNGNNQSNGDVGVTVERRSLKELGMRTRDARSVIAFLKPWVLELINSRARDDQTYKYHDSFCHNEWLINKSL